MTKDSDIRAALVEAAAQGTKVRATVMHSLFRCCGGGWQPRSNYVQSYEGVVVSVDAESFLLQCHNDFGKRAEMIAEVALTISVKTLVD